VEYYPNGFPASVKGFFGRPIKSKLDQFLRELCDGNSELVKAGDFAPRLADNVPRGPFITKLRAYYRSRIKVGNPFFEKHVRLDGETDAQLEKRLAELRPLVDSWVK